MFSKILKQLFRNKFTTVVTLLVIVIGGYFGYQAISSGDEVVHYTVAAVEKGTLIISVSGSGQVSASNQVDIKSKVKSEVVDVYIEGGEEVKEGELIAKLDDTDYQKAVEDAEISLETAKLELEKLLTPDELALLTAENALAQAEQSKQKVEDNVVETYEDAFNTISNTFSDFLTIITGMKDVLYSYGIIESGWGSGGYKSNDSVYINFFGGENRYELERLLNGAINDYKTVRESYNQNFESYKNMGRYPEREAIEDLLNETIETTKSITQAIKSETNLLYSIVDYIFKNDWTTCSKIIDYQSDLKTYNSKINSYLQSLLSIQKSFRDNREALVNAEQTIEEKELSLAELKAGPDELEIRTKEIAVQQKEDTLLAVKQDLADCYIYAPFNGIITETKIKKDDSVSVGTVLANIITHQKIAEITFNEIDAANIKAGQKATLIFDALPEVSISGKVIEVDIVGQVSQGVVSYGVKIALDTDVEQVKPGMSITADIITEAKQDVLVLPNSAIKAQGESYYVELAEVSEEMKQQLLASVSGAIMPTLPKLQLIEIGLVSDFSTEIVAGLQEGDVVVSSTINPSAAQTTQTRTTQTQGLQIPGMSSGGGDQVQMRIR